MATQRIRYIDAIRGFTMILVVFAHVCHFCLGDSRMGYNTVFILFRLPCFFMLSGWLFEPVARYPFMTNVRHKFMVQIVPTFIFLMLLAPPPLFFHQLGALKGGYWFTFVLFEFFILYMLSIRLGRRCSLLMPFAISVGAYCYARYYSSIQSSAVGIQASMVSVLGFLSVVLWRFFFFFAIGAWMRRHFDAFICWTNKPVVFLTIAVVFCVVASSPHLSDMWYEMLRFYIGGISGMWLVFTCFRLTCSWLERIRLSRPLQYVGQRTLDIYLLHYFFLPRFLMPYADRLQAFDSRLVEFVAIMVISLVILALSLLASRIIRLSPFLGHYLFGVKYAKEQPIGK